MKRPTPDPGRSRRSTSAATVQLSKDGLDPPEHLGRRPPGERQQQDSRRVGSLVNQPRHTVSQGGGFARASTGDDQQRRIAVAGGLPLRRVQLAEYRLNRC